MCFAVATAPELGQIVGSTTANVLCFVGSWFFTSAAWIQLVRSGPEGSADWLAAATQFPGTVLFNVSTGAAVWAHRVDAERGLVWTPDAAGSVAFLVSGVIAVLALGSDAGRWAPKSRDWQATWINMVGCIAFGVSALGAFVIKTGAIASPSVANAGTFLGALCFLAAALLVLPRSHREASR
ncbi:hypothetical protein NGTWS0302_06160 [Mycolicibacterium cyprinidarum]|uniref:YrhK domain-containing protein n=1 Tax=Mycolicibacterium cyprinidarum TaxID=2860311 RepID=A0ABQ4V9C0_9MYCO|nr:hypothetical protein NGTWS1702_36420 [Mycolicibacterium sp. NGTWSNA01]GJF13923.1 hypothetical protein NGTWS1803_26070 [Mycolicibacterium sp. NGTWS1803]GJF14222.1 hypothetical protein NGTWS0302_06160 [Mycolicibacterium sp. NGTWS0302]